MASFRYLYTNRAKFSIGSNSFFRAWGKRLFSFPELLNRNLRRNKLIKKGAIVHETAEIGEVNIAGGFRFLSIGRESFLGRVTLNIHDEIKIGSRVCINDGVEILTASHDVSDPKWKEVKAKIIIEDYVWIGIGAMILPGVTIGRGAVVGARAVVSKSVEAGAIVVGNPAKIINRTRGSELNYNPCEFLAANRAWLVG
jgi:acetyltransferase-like isoleucine patch superfamily enzyme